MTVANMLEKLAAAVEAADEAYVADFPGDPFVARAGPGWSNAVARASLTALLTPDEEMLQAGADNLFGSANDDWKTDAEAVWCSMVHAALGAPCDPTADDRG